MRAIAVTMMMTVTAMAMKMCGDEELQQTGG
jgi:hypothetical protein